MALQILAAHAANNLVSDNVLAARNIFGGNAGHVEMLESRATSGNNTVNIFIDSEDPENFEYAVSVVAACASETVYEIRCTAGPDAQACGANAPVGTVTENASEYKLKSVASTKTAGIEVVATAIESCNLAGTTAATCTATLEASAQGQKTSTAGTITYTNAATLRFDVSVTGGAEKLANPTGTCSSDAAGLSSRAVAFWGFLGAIGAIGVIAL
ncbi:hypothetical protein F5Y12DRAFT_787948 [Xylaria sp. FL1777]|nr:hypothetical protein F5Y12DRAFT_787948 [Xylaria sp. FL1777]